jgi:hypothetical protein
MKKSKLAVIFIALLSASLLSVSAQAATNCAGKVSLVLKWDAQCAGQVAFILADGSEKWFCTRDKTDTAIVLTAQASGADLLARLADSSLTACSQNPDHYTTPAYIIVTSAE